MFIFKVVLVLELDQLRHEEAVLMDPVVIEKILSTELTKLIPVIQITRYLRWLRRRQEGTTGATLAHP